MRSPDANAGVAFMALSSNGIIVGGEGWGEGALWLLLGCKKRPLTQPSPPRKRGGEG